MKMTVRLILVGSLLIFFSVLFVIVFLSWATITHKPSDIYRARTAIEERGRRLYVNNGCSYCHTQFIRRIDWGHGAERIAQAGDYISERPHLLGTERTGPDLSQEGGEHPDDWHIAHFINPRFLRPESLMPNWTFLGMDSLKALTAYMQSLGYKDGDTRVDRQLIWKRRAIDAFEAGTDENVAFLHEHVPEPWRNLPNPYPTTDPNLKRGHRIYQAFCIGCHGPIGDGMGPGQDFLYPPPLNFTTLKGRGVSGGILYYQIMNGITGTAMPYFKRELESEKIWDVGNYVAVTFIGETDANTGPRGIDASWEPLVQEK